MPRDAPPDGPEPAGAGDDASLLWAQIEALRSADAAQQLALEGLAATIQVQVEALRSADAAQQLALEGLAAALEDQVQSLRGADTAQRRALDGLASSLQERVDPLTARRRGAAATQLVGATPASRRRGRSGDRGLSDRLSWPPGRPRVLVTQAWLANAGDAAIAVALDGMLRAISPEASILHAAFQHDSVGPLIPGLSFVPPLEELLGTPWAPPAPGWEERGAALVESADLVLAQGGGYLVEGYQPWSRIAALAAVAHRGLPIGLVGVTVEPFRSEAARGFLRELLSVAALVDVRDEPSLEVVTDLGAVGATLGTDLALALFPRQPSAGERRGVGVVLTDHSPLVGQRSRVAALAASVLAETARATPGEQLTLWSTVQGLP